VELDEVAGRKRCDEFPISYNLLRLHASKLKDQVHLRFLGQGRCIRTMYLWGDSEADEKFNTVSLKLLHITPWSESVLPSAICVMQWWEI
jgi:hypothetical protein